LSLAAVACGVDGLFMEVHPDPQVALSDKATSYPLYNIENLIKKVLKIREAAK
jgi:2-dehydro-3-deoxyphosphooctonate aldolase (KDO 8-P synthase)